MIFNQENLQNTAEIYRQIQKSRYFYFSLTYITVSVFIIYAIRPAIIDTIRSYRELSDLNLTQKALDDKKLKIEKAKELKSTYAKEVELIKKAIPNTSEDSIFIWNINEAARKNNVIIESIKFDQPNGTSDTDSDFHEIQFTLTIDSTFENLQSFISELNNFLRLTTVNEIIVEQNSVYKNKKTRSVLKGSIYYRERPKVAN